MRFSDHAWRLLWLGLLISACKRSDVPRQPSAPARPAPQLDAGVSPPTVTLALPESVAPTTTRKVAPLTHPATDWHVCARQGAQLRALCAANAQACFDEADGKIADCYRAVYAHHVDSVADRLELLGPRFAFEKKNSIFEKDGSVSFRQEGDAKYLSPRRFAEGVCIKDLADVPRRACIDEIIFGVDRLVWMGGFGAGP